MNPYNEALEDAVFLHLRCVWQKQNNNSDPGKCFKDDKELYLIWDSASADEERCYNLIENLKAFAQNHPNWNKDLADWCMEVLNRNPIHIRTREERWKSTRNNHQIWKLLMQYHEMVLKRLEEDEEKTNTFSQHFEYTKA